MTLTKEDLASVVTLIDAMAQRGAVKGEELSIIGSMRVKFEQAVKDMIAKENENEKENDPPE